MEEKKRLCRVSGATALLLGLCAAAANLVMLFFAYDETLLFFEQGLPLQLFLALVGFGCLAALLLLLLLRKAEAPARLPSPGGFHTLLSALCGFFLAATVAMQAIYFVCKLDPGVYAFEQSHLWMLVTGGKKFLLADGLQMLSLLLAIPAGLYFLFPAFSDKPKTGARTVFGVCFVLWALAQTMVANFRVEAIPMNSPLRLEPMLAGLAAALYVLAEMRFLVGKGRLNLLFSAATVGLIFAGGYGLTVVVLTVAGKLPAGLTTLYAAVYLLLGCCIAARMLCTGRLFESEEIPASAAAATPAAPAKKPAPQTPAPNSEPETEPTAPSEPAAPENDPFLEQLMDAFAEEEPAANEAPLAFPDEKE